MTGPPKTALSKKKGLLKQKKPAVGAPVKPNQRQNKGLKCRLPNAGGEDRGNLKRSKMNRIWILLLLIFAASLPVIIVFLWLRLRKSAVTLPWFLASLAAGIVSLLIATLIQSRFPSPGGSDGFAQVLFGIFIRIAFIEEAGRLLPLVLLLKAGKRRESNDSAFGAALGLAAGLGFAALENASYGMANINITLLRAFTAAPLHGACGIRAGAAVSVFHQHPAKAIFLFLSAVFIHVAYNLMILIPTLPSALAIPTAFIAFFASLPLAKTSGADEENFPTLRP